MQSLVPVIPFDYEACRAAVYSLKKRYPFLDCRVIGRSHAGRAIFAVSLGKGVEPVLISAGFHGVEWITSLALCTFLERVCESVRTRGSLCGLQIGTATEGRELVFVPMANPDGVQIAIHGAQGAGAYREFVQSIAKGEFHRWNANAQGVDINHNFNAGWQTLQELEREAGIQGPAPRQYGGAWPESEPETAALTRLCRCRQPRHMLALHSQGEEIYWEYGETRPPQSERLAKLFSAASGYDLIQNAGLASHGGFKDWFIQELGRPGFTIEIGKGQNPLPLADFPQIYEKAEYLLALAAVL